MASKGQFKKVHNDWKRRDRKGSTVEILMKMRTQNSKFFLSRFD